MVTQVLERVQQLIISWGLPWLLEKIVSGRKLLKGAKINQRVIANLPISAKLGNRVAFLRPSILKVSPFPNICFGMDKHT